MAATQRPIVQTALAEPATTQTWRTLPSWFIWGSLDRNIPAAVHHLMADRAGAVDTIEVAGSAHAISVSHPDETTDIIRAAVKHIQG